MQYGFFESLHYMVKRALGLGVKAKYVLMDSWFAMPSTIAALRQHIHVVGMIKRSPIIVRYMFLALEQRCKDDQRTLVGSLFRACCSEMEDLKFMKALKRILELAGSKLRSAGEYVEDVYQNLISAIYGAAIKFSA